MNTIKENKNDPETADIRHGCDNLGRIIASFIEIMQEIQQ
jgi:hypothetical protein